MLLNAILVFIFVCFFILFFKAAHAVNFFHAFNIDHVTNTDHVLNTDWLLIVEDVVCLFVFPTNWKGGT